MLAAAAELMRREGIGAATFPRVAKEAAVRERVVRGLFGDEEHLRADVLALRPASEVADLVAHAAHTSGTTLLSVLIEAGHRLFVAPQQSWSDADLEALVRARANPELRELARARIAERVENIRLVASSTVKGEILDPVISPEALAHFLMSLSVGLGLLDPVVTTRPSVEQWDGLIARVGMGLASERQPEQVESDLGARWRLRVVIPDSPGALARLVGALAVVGVYTIELRVEEGAAGERVIYLAVLAPRDVSADVVLGAAASAGTGAYITEGQPDDGQDMPSRILDVATHLLRHPMEAPSMAATLVGADRFEVIDATEGLDEQARVLRLQWTAMQHVLLFREWGPFTRTEQLRASSLLRLSTEIAASIGGHEPVGWIEGTRAGTVWIRLARPEDASAVAQMHERSSERTRYQRYFSLQEWRDVQLRRLSGGHRGATLVVVSRDRQVIGLGNVFPDPDSDGAAAEVALLVEDAHQGEGIGKVLLARMLQLAVRLGFTQVVAHVLADNGAMRHVLEGTGLHWHTTISSGVAEMRAELTAPSPSGGVERAETA